MEECKENLIIFLYWELELFGKQAIWQLTLLFKQAIWQLTLLFKHKVIIKKLPTLQLYVWEEKKYKPPSCSCSLVFEEMKIFNLYLGSA